MIKGLIYQEDKTIIRIYTPNIGEPKYIKQILIVLKGKINDNTIIAGYFNTPLSTMNRSSGQKISKKTLDLNYTLARWT